MKTPENIAEVKAAAEKLEKKKSQVPCLQITAMKFIIIYITHKNLKEAKKVAEMLLKDKLIACVNYFPIESSYWWLATSLASDGGERKITNSKEVVSIVKTKKENWTKVKKAVEAIHPYEVPCIMKLEVESNKSYADWIKKETR